MNLTLHTAIQGNICYQFIKLNTSMYILGFSTLFCDIHCLRVNAKFGPVCLYVLYHVYHTQHAQWLGEGQSYNGQRQCVPKAEYKTL